MDEGPGSSYVPSSPRKVLVVVGTRPEAIKLLPLVKAIRASPHMDPVVVATGQHPRVVEEVLGLAGLDVDVNLAVADPALSLNGLFRAVTFPAIARGLARQVTGRGSWAKTAREPLESEEIEAELP